MTSTAAIWMTSRAHDQLQTELQELLAQRHIEMPDGDSDDYALSQPLHSARQARIGRIEHLLSNALTDHDPPDDGIAEPGMVLTVRYDDTNQVETFLLAVREAEDSEMEVYSTIATGQRPHRRATGRTPYLPHTQRRDRGGDAARRGPLRTDPPSHRRKRGQPSHGSAPSCRAGSQLNGVERS